MDVEKNAGIAENGSTGADSSNDGKSPPRTHMIDPTDPGEADVVKIRQKYGVLRRLRDAETWLDRKLKFEAMGVERIPDEKRRPPQKLNMMLFWFSLLLQPVLIPIGMLGPTLLGLSVNASVILTVFATLIGTTIPAFAATLCPQTGLRQIAVSRFAFGIEGAKLIGLLNIVVNAGYGVVSAVVGGELIAAVSEETVPLALGIVIIVLLGFVVSFLGYAVIHLYERYAWFVAFILFCVTYGQSAKFFSPSPGLSTTSGIDYTGGCLSYFAIVFGVCASWSSIAGDYVVHYHADTSKWLIFGLTYFGQVLPTIFVGVLGNLFGGIVTSHEDLAAAYGEGGTGELLLEVLTPIGWAKTASVLFFLSFLGNIIANIYSAALSLQLWGKHWIAVPRSLWCLLLSVIILALALGGRDRLEAILENLLSLLGYWTLAFGAILFLEDRWFRRAGGPLGKGYDASGWQDRRRVPWGVAGTGTLLIAIGVSFLGMNQTWYKSPGAKVIGVGGGDIGDYIVFGATFLFYPILRTVEIRLSGR